MVNPSKALPPLQSSDVFHHIKMTGPPIVSHLGRLDGEKCAAAKEFDQLEWDVIVRRSDSPWFLPLHMVEKVELAAVRRFLAAEFGLQSQTLSRFQTCWILPTLLPAAPSSPR